jgi:hypothetical protein
MYVLNQGFGSGFNDFVALESGSRDKKKEKKMQIFITFKHTKR